MMNVFRLAGDMAHVVSFVVLLLRLRSSKNPNGISLKTLELYLLVFVTRYLDLFTHYYSLYNSVMKISYISITAYIIYMIRFKQPYCAVYDKNQDSFLHWQFAVAPAFVIALIIILIKGFHLLELLWTFSIILEAIAIIPQLIVLQRFRDVENLTANYVFFLGAYRALYILNWIYRAYTEEFYTHNYIVYICGIIQTALYADFFYYYVQSKYRGGKFTLPE